MSTDSITDQDRYPTLSEHGRDMLRFLREHPCAPIYRNESGNRLMSEDIVRLKEFITEVEASEPTWTAQGRPPWIDAHVARCYARVPFYQRLGVRPVSFVDIPPISRADLARDVAQFVPDDLPLDRLINFNTTGTTGHPLLVPSHPLIAASYLAFHQKALRRFGITLRHGRGQVGVVLVGYQSICFTYVSVTPALDESGLAKINLHPNDWRDLNDRAKYLDAMAPEVYTGDPISLRELARLPLQSRPSAILSTSMALAPALRRELETHFGCPVLDIYSLNEAGPIAVADEREGGHVLLQHRMYVEILDAGGQPVPPGARGEITLTGGFNFYLPLLRYRTGDHGALRFHDKQPIIVGLEGRPPVMFWTAAGEWINNIEITHALKDIPLAQFSVHQDRQGGLHARLDGNTSLIDPVREALLRLFGPSQAVEVAAGGLSGEKVIQYTTEMEGGCR